MRRDLLLLAGLVLLIRLPFLAQPIQGDDVYYLAMARNGLVDPTEDNMLAVTHDGRSAALDLRLVDRTPDPTGGKLEAAAARIARIHHDTAKLVDCVC